MVKNYSVEVQFLEFLVALQQKMYLSRPRSWQGWLLAAAILATSANGKSSYFDNCDERFNEIRAGSLTYKGISNETIDEFIWHDSIRGLDPSYPREDFLAITTYGKFSETL